MCEPTDFEILWKSVLEESNSKEEAQRLFEYSLYWIEKVQLNAYQEYRIHISQERALNILVFAPNTLTDE